jgi:DNA repair exonuclease SbcCD ATPase subunit
MIDKIKECQSSIKQQKKNKETFEQELKEIEESKTSIDDERNKLQEMITEVIKLNDDRTKMSEDMSYYDIIGNLLKDTGIKAKIIKQYIPVINKLINEYLDKLDFFVNFNLDEEFNETLKSRHRDTFKYDNFSEGERQKIDLSILFAFREIARMKSSISCNLLFLDEILDSHMDQNGVDSLMSLLRDMKDTNIVVISHRSGETMMDKFDNVLTFTKVNNYSVLSQDD